MRHVAVIGSGPAGYYSAEALQKQFGDDVRVDMIDRMPVPYGLIRFGVAPGPPVDQGGLPALREGRAVATMSASRQCAGRPRRHASPSCSALYDAVILATGAPNDRPLDIPGGDLPGVIGSAALRRLV